jgi:ABC-2 type transport system permease protein
VVGLFSIAGESWRWIVDAGRYLPSQAASTLTTPGGAGDDMWPAAIALTAWVVVPLALGWLALRSRDA